MARTLLAGLAKYYPELIAPPSESYLLSIEDAYTKFCHEMAGTEVKDKRGQIVKIDELNFTKFLNMKQLNPNTGEPLLDQNGKPVRAKASVVIKALKEGTFDRTRHYIEAARLRTLFWIPEVLGKHDSINKNIHKVIAGDQVYVKQYAIDGPSVKLAFTLPMKHHRIVVTSFLVEEDELHKYVDMTPIWPEKK